MRAKNTRRITNGESWIPVPEWPGFHVTRTGRIRGPSGRELRPMARESGHLFVTSGTKSKKLYVHRAVLLTFVGKPGTQQETRHLDGDPKNNDLSNLRWGTSLENAADRRRHGRLPVGEKSASAKLAECDVADIRRLRSTATLRSLATKFGVSHTAIRRAALGITWNK